MSERENGGSKGGGRKDRWRDGLEEMESEDAEKKQKGKPTKQGAAVEKKAVTVERQADAEPDDPDTMDEERPSKARKSSLNAKGKMSNKNKIIIVAIILLIIGAAVGYYIISSKPKSSDPVAKIEVSGGDPQNLPAGVTLTLDGSGSDGKGKAITDYQWDFGDSQTANSKKPTHAYTQEGDYTVTLTVTNSAGTNTASIKIHVVGTAVMLPVAMVGDAITYDISGYVDITNPQGFWTYTYTKGEIIPVQVVATVTHARIEIDPSSSPTMDVTTDLDEADDGFSEFHSCLLRKTTQDMGITGKADVTLTSAVGSPSQISQDLAGDGRVNENTYTDLNTNRTTKTTRTDNYNIRLTGDNDVDRSGSDQASMFPKNREEFNVDALRANRTFKLDDSGEHTFGTTKFYWTVEAQESVGDKTCLKVHITMDPDAMSEAELTAFDLYTWISSEFSMPLRMYMHSEGSQSGNTVKLDYSAVHKSFTPGTEPVPYGTCPASTPDGHFYMKYPDLAYGAPGQYAPEQGNAPSLETYPLEDGIDYAKANSPGLVSYLDDNPDAFLAIAYYNSSGSVPKWNFTFGVKDSTSAYNVIVSQSNVLAQASVTIPKVGRSVKEYSEAATFEGAEQVLQARDDTKDIYSGGKIDADSYSFGSKADVPSPRAEIPISMNIISSGQEYYFYVESSDGTFFAGVDAQTGQMLYVKTHSSS